MEAPGPRAFLFWAALVLAGASVLIALAKRLLARRPT